MSVPAVPWWPPDGSDEITENAVRQLFGYLRRVTPAGIRNARWRIREQVGNEPIRVDYVTVQQLIGRRLGTVDVATLIWLSSRNGPERVSVAIGLRNYGRPATTMGTPERRQQEWVVWK